MNRVEEKIEHYNGNPPKFYRRFVDDIFLVFENQSDCQLLYDCMNHIDCYGCNTRYIGQTIRPLRRRVSKYRQRSRERAIKDQLLTCYARNEQINIEEFTVIKDGFERKMCRRFYESISIKLSTDSRNKNKAKELANFVQSCLILLYSGQIATDNNIIKN